MTFTPADVRVRRFCFCIPVRAGTMLLSLLAATISAMLGIQATMSLFEPSLNAWMIWVCLASIVLWFSLVVVCLYGWAGCLMKKREWVDWFYELVWVRRSFHSSYLCYPKQTNSSLQWHLWINCLWGIYYLIMLSLPASKQYKVALCIENALDALQLLEPTMSITAEDAASASASCLAAMKTWLLIRDFGWSIGNLLELYLVLIIGHYLDELADDEAAAQYGVDIETPEPPYRFADAEQEVKLGRNRAKAAERTF
ncbi:hypothetical protein JCM1840_000933 [Sporobolomyces johnsonii]